MNSALTVAHVVPYSVTFPLQQHNGRYDWLLNLTTRQAASGLRVIIYSNPDSNIAIPGVSWRSVEGTYDTALEANTAILRQAFSDTDIAIYQSHFDNLHYTVASETARPIVFTQHWWPTEQTIDYAARYASQNVWAVPPTNYMLDFDRTHSIRTAGCIYHGVDLEMFHPASGVKSDRLLFVGRISPEKNLPIAIAAAKKAGLGLDIIGKIVPKNQPYWQGLADSIDGTQIAYLGSMPVPELVGYYNRAAAVIFPADEHEPFGLVAIEAQACGTPVLSSSGGSRGELVADGVSGFLCSTVDDFAAAALKAQTLSPADCAAFAAKFDASQMVDHYTSLYNRLTDQIS